MFSEGPDGVDGEMVSDVSDGSPVRGAAALSS